MRWSGWQDLAFFQYSFFGSRLAPVFEQTSPLKSSQLHRFHNCPFQAPAAQASAVCQQAPAGEVSYQEKARKKYYPLRAAERTTYPTHPSLPQPEVRHVTSPGSPKTWSTWLRCDSNFVITEVQLELPGEADGQLDQWAQSSQSCFAFLGQVCNRCRRQWLKMSNVEKQHRTTISFFLQWLDLNPIAGKP